MLDLNTIPFLGVTSACLLFAACNFFETSGAHGAADATTNTPDVTTERDAGPDTTLRSDMSPAADTDDDAEAMMLDASDMTSTDVPLDMPLPDGNWIDVSAGAAHTCALDRSGQAYCWGYGGFGRLGSGSESSQELPEPVIGGRTFGSIVAGGEHTCALDPDGGIWCWGYGGHIGSPDGTNELAPFQPNTTTWKRIDAGTDAVCGIDQSDYIKCWGENDWGQLGYPDEADRVAPVDLGGAPFRGIDVSIGNEILCALDMNGDATCWGRDLGAAVDDGSAARFIEQSIDAPEPFVDVETGEDHACARTAGDVVYCWGHADLVRETTVDGDATTAGLLVTSNRFEALRSGEQFSCGLEAGTMYCWGSNYRGRQGKGTDNNGFDAEPVEKTASDATWAKFSLGRAHGCGITTNDELLCWGLGWDGRLGNGLRGWVRTPVEVVSNETFVRVAAADHHTCALTADDQIFCWGRGGYGALGLGNRNHQPFPTEVPNLTFGTVGAAGSHAYGLSLTGEGWVWGLDPEHVLGNGPSGDTTSPVTIDISTPFTSLSIGVDHGCGVLTDGDTVCWGDAEEVGFAAGADVPSPAPIGTTDHPRYTVVAAGWGHTCGLAMAGKAHCFGRNGSGQLGDGSTTDSLTASVAVSTSRSFKKISAGQDWTCAIDTNDDGLCWGRGLRVGDGSGSSDETSPVLIASSGRKWDSIEPYSEHTCGTTLNGEVYCWGEGRRGKLGTGSDADADTPQRVVLPETAVHAAAGEQHSCAVGVSGKVWCWGSQEFGTLGDGIDTIHREPVPVDTSQLTLPLD